MKKYEQSCDSNNNFNENDFIEIVTIFGLAIEYITLKIHLSKELPKLAKLILNLLNYIYIIVNILNNSFQRNIHICVEKRISEGLVNCFSTFCEKNVFYTVDMVHDKLDNHCINTKAMIFRTLFHTISFVKNLKDRVPSTFVTNL